MRVRPLQIAFLPSTPLTPLSPRTTISRTHPYRPHRPRHPHLPPAHRARPPQSTASHSSPPPSSSPSPPPSSARPAAAASPAHVAARAARVSTTAAGRLVVELCALVVGAALLLVVLGWRAARWLANVGRLGKWAVARAQALSLSGHAAASRRPRPHSPHVVEVEIPSAENAAADVATAATAATAAASAASGEVQALREELLRTREALERVGVAGGVSGVDGEGGRGVGVGVGTATAEAFVSGSSAAADVAERLARASVEKMGAGATTVSAVKKRRTLVVMRHAKSIFDRSGGAAEAGADFSRALSDSGTEDAKRVGAALAERGVLPSHAVCSSATRTVETMRLVRGGGGVGEHKRGAEEDPTAERGVGVMGEQEFVEPSVVESLYFAISAEEMATALDAAASPHSLHAHTKSLLCVAHNPGCEALVEHLSGESVEMRPATAVVLEELEDEDDDEGLDSGIGERRARDVWELAGSASRYKVVDVLRPRELRR